MIAHLPLFHRVEKGAVIVLGEGDVADARARLVERAGGCVIKDWKAGLAHGARLAFVAYEGSLESSCEADDLESLVAQLRGAGLLVNVADQPALCDFVVPSILDRAPVLLAMGTGGASAGLAKALRLRLDALLPADLGALARALQGARAKMRSLWPDAGQRRRALDAALAEGGVLDPLQEGRFEAVGRWLDQDAAIEPDLCLEIVLRSHDPEELTLREARLLGSVDTLVYERTVPDLVLNRARADAVRIVIAPNGVVPNQAGLQIVLRDGVRLA